MVDWRFMFLNKNVHEQVSIFNNTLMNIFSNYIPNKYITIDDRDPPWMNETIKNKIKLKKSLHKSNNFIEIQKLSTEISDMMLKRKEKHYHHQSLKLNNPNTSAKTYWSILKSFYNDTKVPLIPPLLVNNKIASDFTKKANLFNDFLATQCTTLTNSSVLPSTTSQSRLNSISFEKEDILNNYRPVSLLPICGKIFERIIYSPVFLYLENNELLTPHQSGFRPNDSAYIS